MFLSFPSTTKNCFSYNAMRMSLSQYTRDAGEDIVEKYVGGEAGVEQPCHVCQKRFDAVAKGESLYRCQSILLRSALFSFTLSRWRVE